MDRSDIRILTVTAGKDGNQEKQLHIIFLTKNKRLLLSSLLLHYYLLIDLPVGEQII